MSYWHIYWKDQDLETYPPAPVCDGHKNKALVVLENVGVPTTEIIAEEVKASACHLAVVDPGGCK